MTLALQICTGQDQNKACSMSLDAYVLRKPAVTIQNTLTRGCTGTPANLVGRCCYMETTEKNDVIARGLYGNIHGFETVVQLFRMGCRHTSLESTAKSANICCVT